jgi:hypothetical protein
MLTSLLVTAESGVPGDGLSDIRTQLEDELRQATRSADGSDDKVHAEQPPYSSVARQENAGLCAPPPQPAFQPGACPREDQFLMQLNLVGRVVSKALDDSSVVSVFFHDLTRHRKKMPPIRTSEGFAIAALNDSGVQSPVMTTFQSDAHESHMSSIRTDTVLVTALRRCSLLELSCVYDFQLKRIAM